MAKWNRKRRGQKLPLHLCSTAILCRSMCSSFVCTDFIRRSFVTFFESRLWFSFLTPPFTMRTLGGIFEFGSSLELCNNNIIQVKYEKCNVSWIVHPNFGLHFGSSALRTCDFLFLAFAHFQCYIILTWTAFVCVFNYFTYSRAWISAERFWRWQKFAMCLFLAGFDCRLQQWVLTWKRSGRMEEEQTKNSQRGREREDKRSTRKLLKKFSKWNWNKK